MQGIPWPGCYGSIQNISALGTEESASLTKLEPDGKINRGQPGSGMAGNMEGKLCHILTCVECRKDGARVEEEAHRGREGFGNVLPSGPEK